MQISEIKQLLSIQTVLDHYQIKVNTNKHCKCPFHKDDTPSLRVYTETNSYHCFGCDKTGDVIQFIQDKEACSKHLAIKKAKSLIGTNTIPLPVVKPKGSGAPFGELQEAFSKMKQNLHRSKVAVAYLQDRGIYDIKLEQGFNKQHYPKLNNCIIYPLKNYHGQIVSFYGRSITSTGKHYYLENRKGLYPDYPKPDTKLLIITESIIDAVTLQKYTNYEVLAMYGTNGFTREHIDAINNLKLLQDIVLFFDGDHGGRGANKTISEKLHQLLPNTTISKVDTPDNEDVNSLVISHEPEILNHLIKNRSVIFSIEKEMPLPNATQLLNTDNPDYITYQSGVLLIAVLGGLPMLNLDKLKVTLRIQRSDKQSPIYTLRQSNIDLYNDDVVTKLIRKLAERLELGTKETQSALYGLINELEHYRLKQIELAKPDLTQQRKLTTIQKQKAITFLKSKNLLQKTNELIGKTGLVGETSNRLLMYLVFTSRLREQPLHIISLGASGTGKTYLQEKISELIPEDHKLEITALSENALYYFDRTELKNKLVLIEDLDGAQDDKILYAIRELMSKKRISKTLPIKDAKGNLKTITLQVEGPITLAGTTTKEKIYEDNANRSILIYLDNSSTQKKKIISYQQQLSAGLIDKAKEAQIKEFIKDVQSVLEPVKVRNPYAPQLHIPETVFKPLRTNAHYLSFIEVITFYHQFQRKKVDGYILTDLKDIEIANELLKEVLLAKSDELTKGCRDFFEAVKRHLKKEKKTTFYSGEIRKVFRMSPNNVKYYLAMLAKYNLIKVIGGHPRKQGYEYEILSAKDYQELKESINALDNILKIIKKAG